MSINLTVPKENLPNLKPKLTVIGVGGAGGNAVNNMIRSELEGVDFVVANTDAQSLAQSKTEHRIQLGAQLTEGLGAGSKPEICRGAAEESLDEIVTELDGAHMAFIAAGMGGGTGTGGAPVIARAAKEKGILTVGVVTKPFQFEGSHRMKQANEGIEVLEQFVDTLIVIPNQNLFRIANEKTTFADAFSMADEVLYSGVRGVTDLMVMPGLINLDFADIRSVMSQMGKAMMGTGEADGERRALDAAEAAIANPLLDDTSMKGAKGVLINITGGKDITLFEVDEAANRIRSEVDDDANIMVGSAFDDNLEGIMRVSVVATGIDINTPQMVLPTMLHLADKLDNSLEASNSSEEMDNTTVASDSGEIEESFIEPIEDSPPESGSELKIEKEIETISQPETDSSEGFEEENQVTLEDSEQITTSKESLSIDSDESFIPPKPAVAEEVEMQDKSTSLRAVPDESEKISSDQSNISEDIPQIPWRMKGVSLFERVTGSGKSSFTKKEEASGVVEVKDISTFSGPQIIREDSDDFHKPKVQENSELENVDSLNTVTESMQTNTIEMLGESDENDTNTSEENTDDLLDIPAFLRRQAN